MVLGWILVVIGLVGIGAGFIGGITAMFKQVKGEAERGALGADLLPTEFIQALTKFVEALTKAPIWLALIVIGILLVGWGATMI